MSTRTVAHDILHCPACGSDQVFVDFATAQTHFAGASVLILESGEEVLPSTFHVDDDIDDQLTDNENALIGILGTCLSCAIEFDINFRVQNDGRTFIETVVSTEDLEPVPVFLA